MFALAAPELGYVRPGDINKLLTGAAVVTSGTTLLRPRLPPLPSAY